MKTFKTRIYEADSTFFEGELESLIIPTSGGEYGVLASHRNAVFAIVPGIIKYRPKDSEMLFAAVSEGMMRIENGDVLILVNTAEHPDEIDETRARERAEEAKEIMLQKKSIEEYYQAEATLRRAMIRLRVKNHDIK